MTEQPQTGSGRDLARQTLAAWRSTAKTAPAAKKKPGRRRADRGNGRDPIGLGAVLGHLNAEQDWRVALDGGSIIDRWSSICPEVFAATTQPVAFDPERGRLDLRPSSATYATQLRMFGGQLAKQINDKLGREVVRSIRVMPVGAIDAPAAPDPAPTEEATVPGSVRTRETASPGYRHVLALHLEHRPDGKPANPLVAAALNRQAAALADPARREPETVFTDGRAELERLTAPEPADPLEASLRAARAMAARERAGGQPVRRLFGAA